MITPLQPIPGLLRAIHQAHVSAAWNRAKAARTGTDPRTAHEAELAAEQAEAEAMKLEAIEKSDAEIINAAELLIHGLATSPYQTADRTLARREFEAAVARLRREIGDPPDTAG